MLLEKLAKNNDSLKTVAAGTVGAIPGSVLIGNAIKDFKNPKGGLVGNAYKRRVKHMDRAGKKFLGGLLLLPAGAIVSSGLMKNHLRKKDI